MAHFTAEQERYAACLVCPQRGSFPHPCKKRNCSTRYLNLLRRSAKLRTELLAVCHWLYDEDLHYFGIKD